MKLLPTTNHADCADFLRSFMARRGIDITVSAAAPIVANPYVTEGYTCPHGSTYWIEPTGEQLAQWAREGSQ